MIAIPILSHDTTYFDALCDAMGMLAREPNTIFLGQGVGCAGTTLTDTLRDVPQEKLLEFPVAEDLQMGFAIGLALEGYLPICIYPRWNFLLLAANQMVNHLDRLPIYSAGQYRPKVIIRTTVPVGLPKPFKPRPLPTEAEDYRAEPKAFDPGPQHDDDFTDAFEMMFRRIFVKRVTTAAEVASEYAHALESPYPRLLVEYTALYNAVPSGVKG